jgi:CheY-like chemotaxis protein
MRLAYIIEDNRDTADSLANMLRLLDFEAEVWLGPLPAVAALLSRVPDVIFVDVHMRGMDGIEVCRYIRREPQLRAVPIVAMSSDTQPALEARMREAGADGFLLKPITMDGLERMLKSASRQRARQARGDA